MNTREIKGAQFAAEVLDSESPVIVEFQAPWCGYCRRLGPALDAVSEKLGIPVRKINVDEAPELETRYDVDIIPTLFLFVGGKPGERLINPPSRSVIEAWVGQRTEAKI